MVSHISWSSSGLPFLSNPLQHLSRGYHDTCLENYNGTISIGGRQITYLRFADDIDGITGEEDELTTLVHNLDTAATKFGMEISAEKTKIMTNNGTLQRDITIHGQKLEVRPLQISRRHNL